MKRAIFILLLFPLFCHAQVRDSLNMAVKLNIASPIDVFYFPTIDLALEHRLTNHLSAEGEYGQEIYHFYNADTSFVRPSGYKAKLEFRFYHPRYLWDRSAGVHGSMTGFYIGLSGFIREEKYNSSVQYTMGGDTTNYTDAFWVEKKAYGANVVFGFQEALSRRILFDAGLGVGILNRTVTDHELQYSGNNETIVDSPNLNAFFGRRDLSDDSGVGVSFSFNVKIGYIIY